MAEVRYKEIKIDDILKNIPIRKKLKKSILKEGEYPVYSSETKNNGIFGYHEEYEFNADYEKPLIVFGDHTRSINIVHEKFSVLDNVKVLGINVENIDVNYIKYEWEKLIPDLGYARHWKVARNVKIKIPINTYGDFDIEKQKEIVKKYEIVEEKKKELKEKLDYFKDVQVDFMATEISNHKEYTVSEIFNISLGDGKYTKSYTTKNIGEFPLYSGQTDGEYANIKSYDYDGSYLTWAKDGLAGYIMHHNNEKFSITNHRGILLLKDEYSDLNLEFLKIILEPIFRKNIKGRLGTQEKNEYTTLSKEMIIDIKDKLKIPINKDGIFDLEKQNQIVSKYKAIEEMKKSILERGLPFTLSNVQFDGETPYIYIYIYKG